MLFYRIARPCSHPLLADHPPLGPYQTTFSCKSDPFEYNIIRDMVDEHCSDWDGHPIPSNDSLGEFFYDEYCGFRDMESLESWFRDWLYKLSLIGFRLYVYKVPEDCIRHGEYQSLAKIRESKLLFSSEIPWRVYESV